MSLKSKFLLLVQFLCFLVLMINFKIHLSYGLILIEIFGFFLSLWGVFTLGIGNFNVQPEVKSNAKFVKKGPYRFSRNPIYSGLIILFGASLFAQPNYLNITSFIVLTLTLVIKIIMEEKFLEERFGNSYTAYKKTTFALIPLIW